MGLIEKFLIIFQSSSYFSQLSYVHWNNVFNIYILFWLKIKNKNWGYHPAIHNGSSLIGTP